jgi:hypothetical protein
MRGESSALNVPPKPAVKAAVALTHRRDVQPLVAVQAHELTAEHRGQHLRDHCFAGAGFALDQQRPLDFQGRRTAAESASTIVGKDGMNLGQPRLARVVLALALRDCRTRRRAAGKSQRLRRQRPIHPPSASSTETPVRQALPALWHVCDSRTRRICKSLTKTLCGQIYCAEGAAKRLGLVRSCALGANGEGVEYASILRSFVPLRRESGPPA